MEESSVIQQDSPNALPLQCILKENDSSNIQWQDLGEKVPAPPSSRLLFLTVEYFQEKGNCEAELSSYSPSIAESERLSPFDPNFSSPGRYSPLCNTFVLPTQGQSQFHNSVVVLPASRNDSQPFSIVLDQSQKRQLAGNFEEKAFCSQDALKRSGQNSGRVTSHQSVPVAQMSCKESPDEVEQKLTVTHSPCVLQRGSVADSGEEKSDFLSSRHSFFQGMHKIVTSTDFESSSVEPVQNQYSSPSEEDGLLSETEGENKSLIGISNENLKQDDLLLTDSDQNNDLLMKSEVLMEVDSYNLPEGSYMSSEIEEQLRINNMEKVDNEYLLPDAMAFGNSESNILQTNLEVFTCRPVDNTPVQAFDKTRLRQAKKHPAEHLGFEYWCEDCEFGMKCSEHEIKIVADKPVPTRARATLPKELLAINKVQDGSNKEGVFARKTIMRRVQFGPVEGKLRDENSWCVKDSDAVDLLLETEAGLLLRLDVTDEHESNWMRFVRKAKTLKEQNLIVTQQGKSLYFMTTRVIPPRQELKVGYSPQYAEKRELPVLEGRYWNCFECAARFPSCDDLQRHLHFHVGLKVSNESVNGNLKSSSLRVAASAFGKRKGNRTSNSGRINECRSCHKTFPRTYSLRRHLMMVHCEKDKENSGVLKNVKEKSVTNTLFKKKSSNGTGSEWLCTHCNLTFDNPSVLNLHTLTHAAEDLESEAVLGIPSVLSAIYHEGEFLVENGDVQCPQCTQEFPSKRQLIDHVTTHGKITLKRCCPDPSRPFKCDQCYKAFATDIRLQKHFLVHGSEETKPYQCDICFKRFLNNSALSCHRKTHNDAKVFDCSLCKKEFDQVFGLKEHVKIHSNDGIFTCPHCSKVFDGYSTIRKHMKAFHSGLQHMCKDCGKVCPTLDKLRMHSLKHSDHREFLCANCGKQFKRKDKLKEHMQRMHSAERETKLKSLALRIPNTRGRRFPPKMSSLVYDRFIYKCRNCMVGFKRRGMLVNHLAKRHPDILPDTVPELNLPILKTTRDYFCQYCDKIYKSSSKRKAHILKNHPGAELPMSNRQKGGIPLLPGIPNPTFSKAVGSVKTAPQGCKWCHKQYASKAKLLQHQRKKHMTLMPESQQLPRVSRNPGSPLVADKITENSTNSLNIDTWKTNKNNDPVKISGDTDTHIEHGLFSITGDLSQDVYSTCKKGFKGLPENISCELLQQAMSELSQSLSEYRLPFPAAQEGFPKGGGGKEGMGEGVVREEGVAGEPMVRAWPELPPYPPR